MFKNIAEHKYKIAIFGMLVTASVISFGLAIVRFVRTDTVHYGFLLWNLLLAWIPFLLAVFAYSLAGSRRPLLYLVVFVSAIFWLMFFPNAPYILTDFQHLAISLDGIPVWYDVILLIWFAWTGLLLGMVSLYLMQEIVTDLLGAISGWLFVVVAVTLSSYGVYIGRFLRWNSWDTFQNPLPLIDDVWQQIRHPFANRSAIAFTLIFALLFLFIYTTLVFFGRLANERSKGSQPN